MYTGVATPKSLYVYTGVAHCTSTAKTHQELLEIEVDLFTQLGLHFKVLDMARGDLGAPAYRKYDVEAWMPGMGRYGEVSSASNCTDYQARRLNIRYRCVGGPPGLWMVCHVSHTQADARGTQKGTNSVCAHAQRDCVCGAQDDCGDSGKLSARRWQCCGS